MDPAEALLGQAVQVIRDAACEHDYEAVWPLLLQIAQDGAAAMRLAAALLASGDPAERAVACDLLGVTADRHETQRGAAASALLRLGASERDGDVQWSMARALGATVDARAVPLLVRLGGHADPDIRYQVALSLPPVWSGDPAGAEVLTLIALTADADGRVRDWATFGLGSQLAEADTATIRAALWERTFDDDPDVREEGICGLARRRDRRSVSLMAGLLAAEDGVHDLVFCAAAVLGASELLPLLEEFDDVGPVQEALAECDPVARGRRDQFAWSLLCALNRQQPAIDAGVSAYRHQAGLELTVRVSGTRLTWSTDALARRADGDPERAAALVAADLPPRSIDRY
jgi:hypothetical protein